MARLPRMELQGVPQHLIQRGNNRQVCFGSHEDFQAYIHWLKEYSEKFGVEIHAWVLMSNHVHLLCTPRKPKAISLMMQSVGRRYVQYFNRVYKRTGTLWEGRYKACVIQEERYLMQVYRYIELNPVRASIVADPAAYVWSSYQINGLGKKSNLCTPHALYKALGSNKIQRLEAYRDLFKYLVDGELVNDIRKAVNKGMALGNDRFKKEIETLSGRRVSEGKRGRRVGWRKEKLEG